MVLRRAGLRYTSLSAFQNLSFFSPFALTIALRSELCPFPCLSQAIAQRFTAGLFSIQSRLHYHSQPNIHGKLAPVAS
jgi:hypothetical protein